MRKLALLSLFILTPSFGEITHIQNATSGACAGSTTCTVSVTSVAADDILVVAVSWFTTTTTLNTVTAGCVTGNFALYGNPTNQSGVPTALAAALGVGKVTGSGACTITATFSTTVGARAVMHQVRGADTTTPYVGHTFNSQDTPGTGTDAVTSTNMSPAPGRDGTYVFGVVFDCSAAGRTLTPGTGFTDGSTLAGRLHSEYLIQSTAANRAATFTSDAGTLFALTAVLGIQPPVAAAGSTRRRIVFQ